MSSDFNIPDIDPTNNESLAGTMQFAFSKLLQNINGMLPAQVLAYDRTANRVQVQLLIAMMTTNGDTVGRPQLASIPVMVFGGGNFMLSFPLKPGDLGWVLANDRDISLFLQSYGENPPNTARTFSFSDGVFIPDVMRNYTIASEDADNFVLGTVDGTIAISVSTTGVKVKAPTVTIDGALAATNGITITGGGGTPINVTGNMNLTGDIAVTGNITATGTITPGV